MTPLEINTSTRAMTLAGDAAGLTALFDVLTPPAQERAYDYHIDALIGLPNLDILDQLVSFNDKYGFYAKRIVEYGEGGVSELTDAMRLCLRDAAEANDTALLRHMLANATLKTATESAFYLLKLPGVTKGVQAVCDELDERIDAVTNEARCPR